MQRPRFQVLNKEDAKGNPVNWGDDHNGQFEARMAQNRAMTQSKKDISNVTRLKGKENFRPHGNWASRSNKDGLGSQQAQVIVNTNSVIKNQTKVAKEASIEIVK